MLLLIFAAATHNTFQWAGQPHKTAPSRVASGPPSTTWFLGPRQVMLPKWHLDRFRHFCRSHTDIRRYVWHLLQ